MKRFFTFIFSLAFSLLFLNASAQDTISRNNFQFLDSSPAVINPIINLSGNETWFLCGHRSDTVNSEEEQYIFFTSKVVLMDSTFNPIDSMILPHYRYPLRVPYYCGKGLENLHNVYKVGDCFYNASTYWEECMQSGVEEYDGIKIDSIAFETLNRTTGNYTCISYPLNTPEVRFNRYMQHFHMGGDKFCVILPHAKPTHGLYTTPWQYLGDSSRFIIYQISRGIVKDTTLPIPCSYVEGINGANLIGDKIAFFAKGEYGSSIPKGDLYLIDTSDFSFQGIYDSLDKNQFHIPFITPGGNPNFSLDFQQLNDTMLIVSPVYYIWTDTVKYEVPFVFSLPDWKLERIVKIPIGKGDDTRYDIRHHTEKRFGVHGDTVIYAFGQRAEDQVPLGYRGQQDIRVVSFSANTGEIFSDVFLELPRGLKMVGANVLSTKEGGIAFSIANDTGANIYDQYLVNYNPRWGVSLREVSSGESVRLHVYPNPAKDFVTVDFHGELVGKAVFEIHDMQGRKVLQQEFSQPLGNKVNVSGLQPGAYSYKLYFNGKAIGEKIIIGQ